MGDLVARSVPYKGREWWTAAVCLWNPQGLPGWRISEKHLLGERCRFREGGFRRVLNDVNSMWRFSRYGEQQKSKCFSWLLNLINSKMPSECQVLILKTTIFVLASKQFCFSHLFCPWQYIRKLALKILQEWFWSTEETSKLKRVWRRDFWPLKMLFCQFPGFSTLFYTVPEVGWTTAPG